MYAMNNENFIMLFFIPLSCYSFNGTVEYNNIFIYNKMSMNFLVQLVKGIME